jgi:hypothetical protein
MKNGDVVTLVTMMGEVIGRLKEKSSTEVSLESPRLFVPDPNNGANGGLAPGFSMTGEQNPKEGTFSLGVVLTVAKTHPDIEKAWVSATSGIIL